MHIVKGGAVLEIGLHGACFPKIIENAISYFQKKNLEIDNDLLYQLRKKAIRKTKHFGMCKIREIVDPKIVNSTDFETSNICQNFFIFV
jgi:hypothetical protein